MRGRDRAALGLAYAVTTFGSFPHPIAGRVIDLGLYISWLGPAFLILSLRGLAPGAAARLGFAVSLAAHASILHWIYIVTVVYGHAPPIAGVAGPLALGAYMATFTSVFSAGFAALDRRGLASPLAAAALWAALDHGRAFVLSGFPWAVLGYAQHENQPLLGVAAVTGVTGLSFVTALFGSALALAWPALRSGRRPSKAVLAAVAGVVAVHGIGAILVRTLPLPSGPTLRVAVLQGNIDQGVKWSPSWVERSLEIYEDLSRQAARDGAAVIVWPESAVTGAIDLNEGLRSRLGALARETEASLVVGAVGIDAKGPGGSRRYFDSAFLVDRAGAIADRYDKAHLVPFGEYLPLRAIFGRFLTAVATGITSNDVTPGDGPRAMRLDGILATPVLAGPVVCFELLFPDLVRRFVGEGAQVLFAITNDAWYGRTGAPYQFLAITELRSAESRVWTARAANTGVSALIDPRGRVTEQTRIFEREIITGEVRLRDPSDPRSPYVHIGDAFAYACWAMVFGLVIRARRRAPDEEKR